MNSWSSASDAGAPGVPLKPEPMTTYPAPPMHFHEGQNFDCSQCAKCCGGWHILVDPEAASKIQGSRLELRVIQETGKPALNRRGKDKEVAFGSDGKCVFLQADKLCGVQGQVGPEAKPHGCYKFPFLTTNTPDGVFVGLSFYCSAAQRNEGRPLQVHQESILRVTDEEMVGAEPMSVHRKVTMEWGVYKCLEKFIAEGLNFNHALAALTSLLGRAGGRAVQMSEEELTRLLARPYKIVRQGALMRPYFAAMVAHMECDRKEDIPGFTTPLLTDRPLVFQRFNSFEGKLSDIEAAGVLPKWARPELDRYLQALLFRKFLIAERPIFHNLAVMAMLPRLFSFCAGLSRLSRGNGPLQMVDIHRAFDECEYSFITHSSNLDRTFAQLGRALVEGSDFV